MYELMYVRKYERNVVGYFQSHFPVERIRNIHYCPQRRYSGHVVVNPEENHAASKHNNQLAYWRLYLFVIWKWS